MLPLLWSRQRSHGPAIVRNRCFEDCFERDIDEGMVDVDVLTGGTRLVGTVARSGAENIS